MKERDLHKAVAAYLDACLPANTYWTTIPGGDGARTMAPGYKRGCPDILVIHAGFSLFIELKGPKGSVSKAQESTFIRLGLAGARAVVCRSLDEVEEALFCAGVPIKARISA